MRLLAHCMHDNIEDVSVHFNSYFPRPEPTMSATGSEASALRAGNDWGEMPRRSPDNQNPRPMETLNDAGIQSNAAFEASLFGAPRSPRLNRSLMVIPFS
jgi:hypothetical protein